MKTVKINLLINDSITVYYNRAGIRIDRQVAEEFELKPNSAIHSEDLFWQILRANCRLNIAKCEQAIKIQSGETP